MADRRRVAIWRPWHIRAPEIPQCPTTVHAEGSQIVWLSQRAEQLPLVMPTPCWLSIEATQSLPVAREQERVRTGLIKSDGCEPTPISAHVRTLIQAKARVTSKGTVSRMR